VERKEKKRLVDEMLRKLLGKKVDGGKKRGSGRK